MKYKFVNEKKTSAQVGTKTPLLKKDEPFELDEETATAYLNEGVIAPTDTERKKIHEFTASDEKVLVIYADDTKESLLNRYGKPSLLELALHLETDATEDNNKTEIAEKILEKGENNG